MRGGPLRVVIPALGYYPEHQDGSSRLAYDEAKYLAELGHEVWLVGMGSADDRPERVSDGALHVLRYRRPTWSAFDPGAHQRAVHQLLKRHVAGPVDLVHAHALLAGAAAFDRYGGQARTCYSVHSPVGLELLAARRGADVRERIRLRVAAPIRSRLEARLLAHCDVLTCDSSFTRHLVREMHGPQPAARVRVVPGWVDLSRFQILEDRIAAKRSLSWPTDRPVLFCLRRFVPRMGLDVLIDAAGRLAASSQPFFLVLAGDGELRQGLMARALSLGLAGRVLFPGLIPDHQLPAMYGAADALVLPTTALECFGLIAIEALACGRPVLATPVGAIPEVLGRLELGWIARDASSDGLTLLIRTFLDGDLPAHLPEFLRTFVARNYSIDDRLPELTRLAMGEPQTV
jgi:glycosyltransferase involved in cell wall biosynthesis